MSVVRFDARSRRAPAPPRRPSGVSRIVGRRVVTPNRLVAVLVLFAFASLWLPAMQSPAVPVPLQVIDGDTVRAEGQVVRLVGFDTPESGSLARCEYERSLAAQATNRLRGIVAAGGATLQTVSCQCRPGTEGTRACNHGRACGTLAWQGQDVGRILIGEGLARPYVCGAAGCPRRQSWCD